MMLSCSWFWPPVLVVLGFGAGPGVVPAFLKATKTVSLSRPWFWGLVIIGFGVGAGVVTGGLKAARTSILSRR